MFTSPSKMHTLIQEVENPLPDCPDSPNCKKYSMQIVSDTSTVLNAIDQVLRDMNAATIEWNEESHIINSVFKIPIFGYKDDLDIAIRQNGTYTHIFIRSASREGYYDLGVNNRRVQKFVRKLNYLLSS